MYVIETADGQFICRVRNVAVAIILAYRFAAKWRTE